MRFTPGTRFGPYELITLLGTGGMGEVYRAHDSRLRRDVALKFLPADVSNDADRLARFEREARALAALNHPHIATIHGLEEANGVSALVLELVEGPTLAARLRAGPLPLPQAVAAARQIAQALDAAHEKGIVHRDLKPANITIAIDGTVKVLDFGLAKALRTPENREVMDAPTETTAGTEAGVVVGTAAYMSPEQARGLPVDRRTDIWAFGCVLFEMLTGRVAFAGETLTDTLARVLERDPEWSRLPPDTPPGVRRLLRQCLEKDPKRRLRDIGDAQLDLDEHALSGEEVSPGPTASRTLPRAALLLGVAVLAAAGTRWLATRPEPVSRRDVIRFTIQLGAGERLPAEAGIPLAVTISPGGESIVYVARRADGTRLVLRRRGEFDSVALAGTEGGVGPFFSPNGQWVGFASAGALRVMPLEGGPSRTVADVPIFMGGTWGADDTILFSPDYGTGLFKVSARGGRPESLTTIDTARGELAHYAPQLLPGGRAALFAVWRRNAPPMVEVVEIRTRRRRPLLEGGNPRYLASGHIVVASGGTLLAAPFDLGRLELAGEPIRALHGVRTNGQTSHFDASLDGTTVYVPAEGAREGRLVWVDREGHIRALSDERHGFWHPRVSPDGTRLLVAVSREAAGNEIWIYDVRTATRTRLATRGRVSRPVWEPDGKRITVRSEDRLVSLPAGGSGEPRLLLALERADAALFPLAWSRTGGVFAYSHPVPSTGRDIWTLRPGEPPRPFQATARDERSAMFSPDGRWMVYAETELGRDEQVYVQPFPGPGDRVVISPGGGSEPVWSPTGREIFYRTMAGRRLMAVDVRTTPAFSAGAPRQLFEGPFRTIAGSFWSNYDVTPDGSRFLMVEDDAHTSESLNVVVGWMDRVLESAGARN